MSRLIGLLAIACCIFVASETPSLSASKDAEYCRAAGDWAEAEMTKRLENSDRRMLDAIEEFGPVQNEQKSYFTFIVTAIYDVKLGERIEMEGLEELNKKLDDTSRKFARNLAEDICVKEFLG